MRWIKDAKDAEWTAAITPDGDVRVTRRWVRPPYREGDDPREEYESFEFSKFGALAIATVLTNAATADLPTKEAA